MQDVDVERVWSGLLASCSSAPAQDVAADTVGRPAKMDEDVAGGLLILAGHSVALGSRQRRLCSTLRLLWPQIQAHKLTASCFPICHVVLRPV